MFLVGGIVMLLNIVGLLEFYGMVEESSLPASSGLAWLVVSPWSGHSSIPLRLGQGATRRANDGRAAELELGVFAVLLLALLVRRVFAHPAPPLFSMVGHTMLGVLYVSWLLGFLLKIYFLATPNWRRVRSRVLPALLYSGTKCSDIGAFLLGSMIGRHKMIPKVALPKPGRDLSARFCLDHRRDVDGALLGRAKLGGMPPRDAAALGPLLGLARCLETLSSRC
ncbi:MAG: hypothetical protein CM1200mP29_09000 [Verrucomicrobiota bacterium]|nr:MAG: hypothetical protein CM1200mP29_09000 [Verrucomicrobiota bacterium]